MKWFNNIKIRSKLLILFGLLTLIMTGFAVFTVVRISVISKNNQNLIDAYLGRQIQITDAIIDIYKVRYANLSRGYLVETNGVENMVYRILLDYEKSIISFRENLDGFRRAIESDQEIVESEKRQRLTMINGIEDLFNGYAEITGKIMTAVEDLDRQEMVRMYEEAIPLGNDISDKLQNLRDLIFFSTRRKALETTDSTDHTINLIFGMIVAFILCSAFALVFMVGGINRPISALETAVLEITNGDLFYPVRSDRKDELGALSNCIGDMVDKISEHNKTMTIMDNMDSMICVSDMENNLLYINKRLADRFGIDKEKSINQKCYKATRNKDAPCAFCQLSELFPLKHIYPTKDFEYVWDDVLNVYLGGTASIIKWVDGSTVLFQASRDVTHKKRQDELLQEALEAAKAASVAKSAFLANMSHEIRTPMNAILGIAEIQLQDDTLAPKIKEALDKIHHSGGLLLNIINDILDLSKIEAGKLELIPAEYSIASLVNDTVTLNMMRIGSKPIEFQLSVDVDTPSELYGDELRIKQILNNILSNSFKYTDEGVVKMLVSAEEGARGNAKETKNNITLVFRVSDTGQGMTKDQVNKLFEEYSRFNMEANRTTQGTGLGMSITRNLVQLMEGEIIVESEPGRGSVFTIRLPQKDVGAGVLGKDVAESLEKFQASGDKQIRRAQVVFEPMPYGSVLVVDDVESNLYVAKGLMVPYGIKVETVMSGFDAIAKIKGGNIYDIVFMDHMMPKMDGIETVKNIRELGYTQPIVALTANAVVGQSEIFLENGFDGFISKPIDVRQLNATLKKFVRDKQPAEVIEAAMQESQGKETVKGENSTAINPQLAEIFARDARKAIASLNGVLNGGTYEEEDIRLYTIFVHAMKSALANIGEQALSDVAHKLEEAGRGKETGIIKTETPDFLDKLRKLTDKLSPREAGGPDDTIDEISQEARVYLKEKLEAIKEACKGYDKKTAKNAIAGLRQRAWPGEARGLLGEMSEHLLNGDFEEVLRIADYIIKCYTQ